jgi:Domain of unknown function (DUF4839)
MSIAPPGYPTDETDPYSGNRQADDTVQHEFKSVQALRGRENGAKTKWQNQGWEFVSEDRGKLRTELNFRRVKPKTLASHLLNLAASLGGLRPRTRSLLVASCAVLLIAGAVAIVARAPSGADTPAPSAAATPSPSPPQTPARPAAQTTAPPSTQTTARPATHPSAPKRERVLTAANSAQVASLLKVPDYCDAAIGTAADKLEGRKIAFDGSIADVAYHGDYHTRYDILVASGDKGPDFTRGAAFEFDNVNIFDLTDNESDVSTGDRFRVVARVGEYNPDQCLLFLEPVSLTAR